MIFVAICIDKPGSAELRLAHRAAHLEYVSARAELVRMGGPLLDDDGGMNGSLLVIDTPDRAAAEAFLAGDPYAKAGLFERVELRAWKVLRGLPAAAPA